MKNFCFAALLALGLTPLASAQDTFNGLEKAMDSDTYERAGLRKLTKDERAVLDQFVRDYVTGKQKTAATAAAAEAVDRAVKEHKVQPPEVIESKMVGAFKGYNTRTVFRLENGQVWKPTSGETATFSAIESPKVIIFRDTFGYKMFIEGAATIRVKRMQ
jgi:flavin-binding protein dodecin